jgi:DNA-binding FadR family transcriptional regulator
VLRPSRDEASTDLMSKCLNRMSKLSGSLPPIDRARRAKLHDRIAVSIGTEIVTGVIPEGSLLPTESEAGSRYQVSRTAYREALRVLVGKGLVSSRTKTGTRVSRRQDWALLDPVLLSWMFSAKPTVEAVNALFELRMIIEPAAAELAAVRRGDDELAEMGEALREMAAHGLTTAEGQQADGRFHSLILGATRNEFLRAMTDPIVTAIAWTTKMKFEADLPARDPIPPHRHLYEAIAQRDRRAARDAAQVLLQQALEDTEVLLK